MSNPQHPPTVVATDNQPETPLPELRTRLLHRSLPYLELLWSLALSKQVFLSPQQEDDLANVITALRFHQHLFG